MHLRLWGIIALCLLAVRPAYATPFDDFLLGQPLATTLQPTDSVPVVQGGETRQFFPASSFMRSDASNASLPDARTYFGLGTADRPLFSGLSLTAPDTTSLDAAVIGNFNYGTLGAPAPADPTYGVHGFTTKVYSTPGTSLTDAFSTASQWQSHLSAGTGGIAVGVLGLAYNDGTWSPGAGILSGSVGMWGQATTSRGASGGVWGLYGRANATTVALTGAAGVHGAELDTNASVSVGAKYGLAIVSGEADSGAVTGTATLSGSGAVVPRSAAIQVSSSGGVATGYAYGLLTIKENVSAQAIQTTGSLWRAGGFTAANGLDWSDMTFSGDSLALPGLSVSGDGQIESTKLLAAGLQYDFLTFRNTSAGDAQVASISTRDYANNVRARIDFITNSLSNFQTGIAFSPGGGGAPIERARFALGTGNFLIGTTTDCSQKLCVQGTANVTGTVNAGTLVVTPASPASGAACTAGQIVADTGFIYACASSGVWKRAALTGGY